MSELKSAIDAAKVGLGIGAGNFSLEYISIAGSRYGNTPEWEARLLVDGTGAATYFRRRGPGDSADFPPGLFEGRLVLTELASFLDLLEQVDFQALDSDPPGPRDPINILRIILAGRSFEFTWGASRRPIPEAFEGLKDRLRAWTLNACPLVKWSLALSTESFHFQGNRVVARLKLENPGWQSIWIAQPTSPGLGPAFGLFLKYGESVLIREGFSPVPTKSKVAPLDQATKPVVEFLEVSPGHPITLEFSTALEGEAPRGWSGKFTFQHYLTEDNVAGLPVFNGALFTEELKW